MLPRALNWELNELIIFGQKLKMIQNQTLDKIRGLVVTQFFECKDVCKINFISVFVSHCMISFLILIQPLNFSITKKKLGVIYFIGLMLVLIPNCFVSRESAKLIHLKTLYGLCSTGHNLRRLRALLEWSSLVSASSHIYQI